MKILVINAGSSSIKYKLFQMTDGSDAVLASGLVERIGEPLSALAHTVDPDAANPRQRVMETSIATHAHGLCLIIDLLVDPENGVIGDANEIAGVGHRVVHGGERFSDPVLVTDEVIRAIEDTVPLAPLHNPPNLAGITTAMALFTQVPHVVVFDTAFFQTMTPEAYLYALPYALYTDLGIRRYGFHGTSHRFVSAECARLMGTTPAKINCITIHLGNGCSMTAVRGGKAVDTSLGMTPLAGLIMGTRSGDVDPAILTFLHREKGLSVEEIDTLLNKESGLKGICGQNDMRDIHAAIDRADESSPRAQLALDMACYRNRKYLGEYLAVLGRTDAVVFTAGIGENDAVVRAKTLQGLEHLGITLDPAKNTAKNSEARAIHADNSPVAVWVIPTNEELEIARQTCTVLAG